MTELWKMKTPQAKGRKRVQVNTVCMHTCLPAKLTLNGKCSGKRAQGKKRYTNTEKENSGGGGGGGR